MLSFYYKGALIENPSFPELESFLTKYRELCEQYGVQISSRSDLFLAGFYGINFSEDILNNLSDSEKVACIEAAYRDAKKKVAEKRKQYEEKLLSDQAKYKAAEEKFNKATSLLERGSFLMEMYRYQRDVIMCSMFAQYVGDLIGYKEEKSE